MSILTLSEERAEVMDFTIAPLREDMGEAMRRTQTDSAINAAMQHVSGIIIRRRSGTAVDYHVYWSAFDHRLWAAFFAAGVVLSLSILLVHRAAGDRDYDLVEALAGVTMLCLQRENLDHLDRMSFRKATLCGHGSNTFLYFCPFLRTLYFTTSAMGLLFYASYTGVLISWLSTPTPPLHIQVSEL